MCLTKALKQICLFTKRLWKQPVFLFLLFLLPAMSFLLTGLQENASGSVRIALYREDGQGVSGLIIEKLLKKESSFSFYLCPSEEELFSQVASGTAECGYLLPADLFQQLDAGKKNHLIDVIVSPSTTLSKVTNEIVYAELFEEYSLHLLENFLAHQSPLADDKTPPSIKAETLYREHMADDSTFSFTYGTHGETTNAPLPAHMNSPHASLLLAPIRGVLAILILLSGFWGAFQYYNDKEEKIFMHKNKGERCFLHVLSISIPVVFTSVMGFVCIQPTTITQAPLRECISLAFYAVLVTFFCFLWSKVIRSKTLFISCIPVFTVGSLLFTPVFMDITNWIPAFRTLCLLFPPYYYLNLF